jgi:hypothetical protein
MIFWMTQVKAETAKIKADDEALKPQATEATQKAAEAVSIQTRGKEVEEKASFVRTAVKYDQDTYQPLFHGIANYTWNRVKYDQIQPNGDVVNIQAYAPLLHDIGQYMLAMERNPIINRVDVQTNDLPGFPNSGPALMGQTQADPMRPASGHNFNVVLHLVKPVAAGPSYPAGFTPSGAGGGGGGGFGGPTMGGPPGMMGSGGMMGGPPGMAGGRSGPPGGMSTGAMMGGPAAGPRGGKGGAAAGAVN